MNISDIHGRIFSANDRFLEMTGYQRDEQPLRWDEMTPPEWLEVERAKKKEILNTGKGQFWEKEYFHKDGSRVSVLIAVTLLEGSREECLAVIVDLTEAKRAEAALQRSEQRYRSLYDDIPLMYFTLDPRGVVQSVNTHGASELGYEPEELIGRSVLTVFHPEDRPAVEKSLEAFVQRPEGVARWEFRKIRKDDSVLWVRESVRVMEGSDGRQQVMVVCEDITERKESELQLLEDQKQLKALSSALAAAEDRTRRKIATGLHDEIVQVLAMAKIELGELQSDVATEDAPRQIAEVRELLDRCIQSARSLTFELTSTVLYELGLEPALQDLGERIERDNGIRFRFEGDGSCVGFVGDRAVTLFRITRELVQNVVQHSRAKSLLIEVARTEEETRVSVEDDGVGFDTDRAGRGPSPAGGFGLFSIREQLEQLGGRLEIRSLPGQGTRVEAVAPVERGAGERSGDGPPPPESDLPFEIAANRDEG
jgi:PAS domain S-box-containing protein